MSDDVVEQLLTVSETIADMDRRKRSANDR